ncbi:cation:proton antiporter domain-containing protein [Leptolyngbya ohadii]|uniref:cation:proton antiporter domain-containing protein n=1 Tax=Leptolyngbya ohadii TaxID=1962290 RepID=UPI000B59FCB3|nr:cation:proton antiporter [Leptolyngbya ohadii]
MSTVVLVLLQVLLVIGLSRLVGLGFRALRQPLVIGEIVAGIMLGPSLLGLIAPGVADALFPAETIPFLNVLSQVGLIFFMFLIGLELNPRYLRGQLETAILTSHVSIVVPFALGALLSLLLYPLVSNSSVSFTAFALFLGAAMSITAFPVLARIITENNLQNTRLGTLALTCAAVDDVTAWCLLALAIAVTRTNSMIAALPTLLEAVVYITLMVTIGRSFLQQLAKHYDRTGKLTQFVLAGIYMGVVASALITEAIGIHLIFGAFLLGAVMPKNEGLTRELAEKTEDFVLTFLLPIFFAYSGLRTQIGLLNRPELWLLCGLVLLVAIGGKFIGTYGAGRVCGMAKREAAALGWLMNTRGLTELIVLNIGLSLGVISPLLFTMLVIMALVTTFMTSPLLELTYPKRLIQQDRLDFPVGQVGQVEQGEPTAITSPVYRILVPVANPNTQQSLVQLATAIAGTQLQQAIVNPLSLIQLQEDYAFESTPLEADRQIAARQKRLQVLINSLEPEVRPLMQPIVRVANDVAREAVEVAEIQEADLILVGWHRPAFSTNRLGGRVGQILSLAKTDVAVFVDYPSTASTQQPPRINQILLPYVPDIHSDLGLELALRILASHADRQLTLLCVIPPQPEMQDYPHCPIPLTENPEMSDALSYELRSTLQQLPVYLRDRIALKIMPTAEPMRAVVELSEGMDLTIAGANREWGIERQTLGKYTDELVRYCRSSLLITRRYSRVTSHLAAVLTQGQATQGQV